MKQNIFKRQTIAFNAEPVDLERLKTVTRKLSLNRSEVSRRALRLGLLQLEKLEIPGSPSPEVEARP